jgi:hypothetical protein
VDLEVMFADSGKSSSAPTIAGKLRRVEQPGTPVVRRPSDPDRIVTPSAKGEGQLKHDLDPCAIQTSRIARKFPVSASPAAVLETASRREMGKELASATIAVMALACC